MPDIERKPAHLMVGLDGEPVRLVEPGALVAGIYDVVEYVPASQLEGAVEDARDAGEASMQAAFWRARAIELGASEDEYRKAHGGR